MNAKRKGTAGENELADILRLSGIRAYRNDQIFKGGKGNPDVFAEIGTMLLHIEVKRVEKLNVPEAMNQAIRDRADGHFPVLCHRRNREKWLVTMPLDELLIRLKEGGII
jgi:Holliday junction resolvase